MPHSSGIGSGSSRPTFPRRSARGRRRRYLYVVRHPASCFASCLDFVRTNVGSLAPDLDAFEQWFRSPDTMWWGTWPEHVRGWWERAATSDRVCWVTFEDMKQDLPGVTRRVASWLGVQLTEADVDAVVGKCSFDYMQANQDCFEMQPPHLMQTDAELFVRGSADRFRDVPADVRERIVAWARAEVTGAAAGAEAASVPVEQWYPDLAVPRPE
ncbi:MAG: sulfotransferase domain-containing protein [Gemmatimonadales bacterium]